MTATNATSPAKPPLHEHATTGRGADGLGLWALLKEDLAAHGGDWTRPGFRAVAVYRFGVWRMGVRPGLLRAPLSVLYRAGYRRIRNHYGIELPYAARVGRRLVIEHQHGIVVHGRCVIGDDCTIRQGCTLGNKTPDRPDDAPTLGDRVNVGAGAKVLGAVRLGDDARVGTNAVVLRDVPAGALAVGVPAVVKMRQPAGDVVDAGADHGPDNRAAANWSRATADTPGDQASSTGSATGAA